MCIIKTAVISQRSCQFSREQQLLFFALLKKLLSHTAAINFPRAAAALSCIIKTAAISQRSCQFSLRAATVLFCIIKTAVILKAQLSVFSEQQLLFFLN